MNLENTEIGLILFLLQVLIIVLGYDEMKDNTWEPAENLSHAKVTITKFTKEHG